MKGLTYLPCKQYEFKNRSSAKRSMIDDKKIKGRREKRLTHFQCLSDPEQVITHVERLRSIKH